MTDATRTGPHATGHAPHDAPAADVSPPPDPDPDPEPAYAPHTSEPIHAPRKSDPAHAPRKPDPAHGAPAAPAPRVLVVQSAPLAGPGRVGEWLRESGAALEVVRAYEGEPLPARLGHRALVVLGGGYLPDADARAPWLPGVRALAGQALQEGTPLLGICLGAQLLAHVAGGTVRGEYGEPEFGSTPIRRRAAAADDPLFGGLPEVTPAIQQHVDTITELPPGAAWLAESDACPYQGFRVGERAWGVQFHPEAEPGRIRRWDAERLRARGHDREALHADAGEDDATARPAWRGFTYRFAHQVAAHSG